MKAIKLAIFNYSENVHDERELSVLRELVDEVAIVAAEGPCNNCETSEGIPIHRLSFMFPDSNKFVRLFFSLPHWATSVSKERPDIISAHDIGALLVAWLASCVSKKKIHLVYDSHEFELGRNSEKARGRLFDRFVVALERFLIKRCAFSIVVNDSIADELQKVHQLQERPLVVRNIPPYWNRDENLVDKARRELCGSLGQNPEEIFLVMYHGMVMKGRGVEQLIEAVSLTDGVHAVVLGDSDSPEYLSALKGLCDSLKVSDRVLFRPAVPFSELEAYVAAADVGVVGIRAICKSYYYMLPNKFFENIQAETPIIASDFPETGRLVAQYGVGLVCDPDDPRSINSCISEMRSNKSLYTQCKANLRLAKEELCWEKERAVLAEKYSELISRAKEYN